MGPRKESQFHTEFWQKIICSKRYPHCIDWSFDGKYLFIFDTHALMLAVDHALVSTKQNGYDSLARQLRIYGWNRLHTKKDLARLDTYGLTIGGHVWKHATLTRNSSLAQVQAVERRAQPKQKKSRVPATSRPRQARKQAPSPSPSTDLEEESDVDNENSEPDELDDVDSAVVRASRVSDHLGSERLAIREAKQASLREAESQNDSTPDHDVISETEDEFDDASEYGDTPPPPSASTSATSYAATSATPFKSSARVPNANENGPAETSTNSFAFDSTVHPDYPRSGEWVRLAQSLSSPPSDLPSSHLNSAFEEYVNNEWLQNMASTSSADSAIVHTGIHSEERLTMPTSNGAWRLYNNRWMNLEDSPEP